jgi:hypothetical protein
VVLHQEALGRKLEVAVEAADPPAAATAAATTTTTTAAAAATIVVMATAATAAAAAAGVTAVAAIFVVDLRHEKRVKVATEITTGTNSLPKVCGRRKYSLLVDCFKEKILAKWGRKKVRESL